MVGEFGERGEHLLHRRVAVCATTTSGHAQVVVHAEGRQHAVVLQHGGEPGSANLIRPPTHDADTIHLDAAGTGQQPGHGENGAAAAGTVGPEHAHHLTGFHRQPDVAHDGAPATLDGEPLDDQPSAHSASSSASPSHAALRAVRQAEHASCHGSDHLGTMR